MAGCATRRDLSKHEEEGEGERKRGGVGDREGRRKGEWGGRKEGREGEGGGTSARCRPAHLPEGAYNMGIPSVEGRRGGGKGGRVEGLERAAKARRSNHAVRTSLEAMQEREQREKVERRCATFAFGARRAASPRCAATSGLGEISNFPFHFASSLGVMLLGISIESMTHPSRPPHLIPLASWNSVLDTNTNTKSVLI